MTASVREWIEFPQMDTGAPSPGISLVSDALYLAYISSKDLAYVVVRFDDVMLHTFGYPNDEALTGHPLFSLGIEPYAFNEVIESPYVEELRLRNAALFPGRHDPFHTSRHWIVCFHDETLEVVASAMTLLGGSGASSAQEAIATYAADRAAQRHGTLH